MSEKLEELIENLKNLLQKKGSNDPEYQSLLSRINKLSEKTEVKRKIDSVKPQSNGKTKTIISSLIFKKPKKDEN